MIDQKQEVGQALNHTTILFKEAMRGNWRTVVDIYKEDCNARKAKITWTGDTVLHVAVSEGNSDVVSDLLGAIAAPTDHEEVLHEKNDAGNTALHLAAALGAVEICEKIARMKPELTKVRNNNGETPLFVAANVGKKDVFFVLQARIHDLGQTEDISHCRRSRDGNTILHRAIYGEYFELAFEIIHIYPDLVNVRNVAGETALHLLAAKPSAFKSGSRIHFLDEVVYTCVHSAKLKYPDIKNRKYSRGIKNKQANFELLQNYGMCMDIFFIFKMVVKVLVGCRQKTEHDASQGDLEGGFHSNQNVADESIGKGSGLPPNYLTCFNFLRTIMKFLLIILGIGERVEKIIRKKRNQEYANRIMVELVKKVSLEQYDDDGRRPIVKDNEYAEMEGYFLHVPPNEDNNPPNDTNARQQETETRPVTETPILLAARMGIIEIVKKIVEHIPLALRDVDSNNKNVVLLAAEHRQPRIYRYLLGRREMRDCLFGMVDKEGNSALHLAASVSNQTHPWNISGSALQMHWEIKWYNFVKNSMELNFFAPFNQKNQTPREIFTQHHKDLVTEGAKWPTETSQSCSVLAALIATVAFASATTIPGGVKSDSGIPLLEGQPAFEVFAISSLVALCFSVTSLVMFLSILTSRYQETDFESSLPLKLLLGLTSLFMSIASMMVAFCGAHFYLIANHLKYAVLPIYVVVCIPVTLFAMAQFSFYFDLIKATIARVPERTYKRRSL